MGYGLILWPLVPAALRISVFLITGLILNLLMAVTAMGQTVRGKVVDGETGEPLASVVVVNLMTQQSAYTNNEGEYNLSAQKGESIAFSYVGYKTKQQTVPASIGPTATLDATMFKLSFSLQEFVLRPGYTPYQFDSVQRASTYSRALARQRSSPLSPVSFIAERLSKRSRRLFRFQKNFYQWEQERFIETRYTADLVSQMTGLVEDSVAYFMNAHPMPYDFARAASDLEIKMWIREQYKLWRKK